MKTVLIADDDDVSRELLRETLDLDEVEIVEASNGMEALRLIREVSPDLALIDIQMPLLDGFGVLQAARDLHPPRLTRIVALTAMARESTRTNFLEAGFDDYIAKPISVSGVRKLVTDLLYLKRSATPPGF